MKMMSREQVERLRERYPIGSRIELHEMLDDPCPIEPGSKGELLYIDDGGVLHIKWDNGRGLGVVPGKDVFSVLSPEQPEKDAPAKPKARRHSGQER